MLNKLTANLKNLIVSTIVSVLALIIGIVLVPVYSVFGTVIITLAALAVLYFGYALIKYIIAHKPIKKEKSVRTVKRTKNWRDWVIVITLLCVITILILLLFRGCGNGTDVGGTIDVLNVNTLNVQTENVEEQNVGTSNVDNQEVVNQVVTEQDVETSNVTEQEVVNQTVVEQDVETSNVTEQVVVNQQVTTQIKVDETPVKDETPKETSKPSTPVHTCTVANTKVTNATCVNSGKVEYLCSCGKALSTTVAPATGHSWNDGNVTVNATESAAGSKIFTCTVCQETKTEVIPKLEHVCKVADTVTQKATCTSNGKIEEICSCGKILSTTTTSATGHSWNKGEVTREATETRTGIKTYTCKKCDETKTEKLDKLEHECEICDEIEIEATCTTKGKIKYVCSCGEVLDTETTAKLGHDYEVVSEKDATATTDGYVKYRCDNCGDTYKDVVPATGEEEDVVSNVKLSANSFVISEGKTVKVTTTGSASDLRLQQSMDQLKMTKVSDTQVELTVKTPGVGGTVSVYDVNTGASVEITIEFIYD